MLAMLDWFKYDDILDQEVAVSFSCNFGANGIGGKTPEFASFVMLMSTWYWMELTPKPTYSAGWPFVGEIFDV